MIEEIASNLNMQTSSKTVTPFLWIGGCVLVCAVFLVVRFYGSSVRAFIDTTVEANAPAVPLPNQEPTVKHEAYVAAVVPILTSYQSSGDAQSAQTALLAMRVPSEDRDIHKNLVTLLGKAAAGQKTEADALYASLRATATWLP